MATEKPNDRLDLLKHLSFIGGEIAVTVFEKYIPDHYSEIYTLFNLLNELGIDYNDIEFHKPYSSKHEFEFVCSFTNDSDVKCLSKFLENNDNKVKYMRNIPYKVYVSLKEEKTILTFRHD